MCACLPVLFVCFVEFSTVSLCSPGYPGHYYVGWAGLELLPLPPKCGIEGMCHHPLAAYLPPLFFWKFCNLPLLTLQKYWSKVYGAFRILSYLLVLWGQRTILMLDQWSFSSCVLWDPKSQKPLKRSRIRCPVL